MTGKASVPGRGRKPKLKIVGNRENKGFQTNISQSEIPATPDWLDDIACQKWEEIAPFLAKKGVITDTDLHNLEVFCQAYSTWRKAQLSIQNDGAVISTAFGLKKNPACTIANECSRQIAAFGALLGLDPTSRSRVLNPEVKPKNAFSALLKPKHTA